MDTPVYLPGGNVALPLDAIESLVLGGNHAKILLKKVSLLSLNSNLSDIN